MPVEVNFSFIAWRKLSNFFTKTIFVTEPHLLSNPANFPWGDLDTLQA
jgi:hypothetical protein